MIYLKPLSKPLPCDPSFLSLKQYKTHDTLNMSNRCFVSNEQDKTVRSYAQVNDFQRLSLQNIKMGSHTNFGLTTQKLQFQKSSDAHLLIASKLL